MSQDIKLLNMYPKNQDNFYSGVQPGKISLVRAMLHLKL